MLLIVDFDQPRNSLVSLVGGKATNLIALTAAGFPVPPGFVVTSDAYQWFVESAEWLNQSLAEFSFDDTARLRQQCDAIQRGLRQTVVPAELNDAIGRALQRLSATDDDAFAVRSSSTLEDLAHAAFAGQHDTFLNIRGIDALSSRVRDCFVSLWSERAVQYRHQLGFSQAAAKMAVVIQRQIPCDRAGVGFSINPVTGNLNRIILNANLGVGESVVSGAGEVDQFELDKQTLKIVSQSVGHKESMIVPTATGVEERPVPAEHRDAACLTSAEITAIGELLNRVENHYGWPQDIEWGWHDHQLFLFQSRAVTTFQPRYTRDESAERFPNPMTPLSWDFICEVFRRSLAHSLALMGLPPLKDDWFSLHHCYIYGNQNAVDLLARYRPLRAKSMAELVEEIPSLRERYAYVSSLPIEWARDLDRYLIRLGGLAREPLPAMSVAELWQHMLEIQQVAADYFLPNIAISITQSFLHRTLFELVKLVAGPENGVVIFDGLMAGCETKTAAVNLELHQMAVMARGDRALTDDLTALGGREFWHRRRLDDFPQFGQRLARFLEDHGHREMDMDYYVPTWSGQPWVVLDSIALMLKSESHSSPQDIFREQRNRSAETEVQFIGQLPESLRFFFWELARLARTYTNLDDLEHYQTTRVNPVARNAALEMGRRLVAAQVLAVPEDVFFFRRDELAQLVAQFPAIDTAHYRQLNATAKTAYERAGRESPIWSLDDPGTAVASADDEVLRGLPGSPGRVTAPCFLVRDPADFQHFPPRSVLVARTTNPAWTPLFYSAAGLITESGGPLSHGAVTAREMQLPAVMSVRGIMNTLNNGQVVTVDGSQGTVKIETEVST